MVLQWVKGKREEGEKVALEEGQKEEDVEEGNTGRRRKGEEMKRGKWRKVIK